jgi:hypothetical protein
MKLGTLRQTDRVSTIKCIVHTNLGHGLHIQQKSDLYVRFADSAEILIKSMHTVQRAQPSLITLMKTLSGPLPKRCMQHYAAKSMPPWAARHVLLSSSRVTRDTDLVVPPGQTAARRALLRRSADFTIQPRSLHTQYHVSSIPVDNLRSSQ